MKTFLSFILLFTLHFSIAQKLSREQFIEDSIKIMAPKLVRPQVRLDNRPTFYQHQSFILNGFDAGVLLKEKMRLTLGYYKMEDKLKDTKMPVDSTSGGRILRMELGAINSEIIYSNSRYFSLGMPLEIHTGYNEFRELKVNSDDVVSTEKGLIALVNFGLSVTFKPIRWIGLKGMVGYRKQAYNQLKDVNFDGVLTAIGLNIDFREIVKDVQMMRLKRKYKRGDAVENAVDLITD